MWIYCSTWDSIAASRAKPECCNTVSPKQGPCRHFEIGGAKIFLGVLVLIKKLDFWVEISTSLVNLKMLGVL